MRLPDGVARTREDGACMKISKPNLKGTVQVGITASVQPWTLRDSFLGKGTPGANVDGDVT